MSVKDRMNMMKGILADNPSKKIPEAEASDGALMSTAPKKGTQTAPGGMLAFRSQLQQHEATVKSLEAKLAQYADGVRTIKLEASLVDESKWANRHSSSFDTAAFDRFKDEIAHAGGNIQPILVRPVASRYEVVFGHRRFKACKLLGLPVLAMIAEMSDEELFTLMDRENRERADLSPFEQGEMWRKAIDEGLFSSARQLASHVGVSNVHVTQCMSVARLPSFVLELFANPTEIQVRWAKAINDQLQADPELLTDRSAKIKALGKNFSSSKIFEMLVRDDKGSTKLHSSPLKHEGKVVGKISRGADGEVSVSIKPGFLSVAAFSNLEKLLADLIGK
ncbi:MAG: chromosome partitioning protein ParB [Burkholderiales bacterium PBB4]|nr:MAG: chromosome partitioning protein ParB [Burkholderiales bacterium PBB4]